MNEFSIYQSTIFLYWVNQSINQLPDFSPIFRPVSVEMNHNKPRVVVAARV